MNDGSEASMSLSRIDSEAFSAMNLTNPLLDSPFVSPRNEMPPDSAASLNGPPSYRTKTNQVLAAAEYDRPGIDSEMNFGPVGDADARDEALVGHEDSHILPGMHLSTKVATAEQKLLLALSQDRHFESKNALKRATVSGHDMNNLQSLRISPKDKLRREILREQELTSAMDQALPLVPWDPVDFPLIEHSKHNRKARHDACLKKYKSTVAQLAEDLEERVIKACRDLRELLEHMDEDIQNVFDRLNIDEDLRERDREYVLLLWSDTIAKKLAARGNAVERFGRDIEGIESDRALGIKEAVSTLVFDLVDVSYLLRSEIQRLVETEAHLANKVIITNLQAASDCTARLRRMHVSVRISRRGQWEVRERDWRRLRHDKAIANFHHVIDSNEYRNPLPRQKVLSDFRSRQQSRHVTTRMQLLKKLGSLSLPPALSTGAVTSIVADFEALNAEEVADVVDLVGANSGLAAQPPQQSLLEECSLGMLENAERLREALRMELHYYGALAEKPDLSGISNAMSLATGIVPEGNGVIEDEELADFFRRAGNLKGTFKKILEALLKPDLVYQSNTRAVLELVMQLRSGTGVLELLEAQGKGGDRTTIQSTLEKLRTGKSADVGKNSKILLRKLRAFRSNVQDLEKIYEAEMDAIIADLSEILEPSSNYSSKSSLHKSSSKISPSAAENLASLRDLQRRACSLIYIPELPKPIVDALNAADEALRQQIYANSKIDAVIEKECKRKIRHRVREDRHLVRNIANFLDAQVKALQQAPQRICKFYSHIAKLAESNQEETITLDDTFEDELVELLDQYDAKHQEQEDLLASQVRAEYFCLVFILILSVRLTRFFSYANLQLHSLRYARNSELLAKYFDDVVKTLELIQQEYRDHGGVFVKRADSYPPEAKALHKKYSEKVCKHFCVVHPEKVAAAKAAYMSRLRNLEYAQDSPHDAYSESNANEDAAEETDEIAEAGTDHNEESEVDKVEEANSVADGDEEAKDTTDEAEDEANGDAIGADMDDLPEEYKDNTSDPSVVAGGEEDGAEDGDSISNSVHDAEVKVSQSSVQAEENEQLFQKDSWEEYQTLPQLPLIKAKKDPSTMPVDQNRTAPNQDNLDGGLLDEDSALVLAVVRVDAPQLARTLIGEPICKEVNELLKPLDAQTQKSQSIDVADDSNETIMKSDIASKVWPLMLPYDIEGQHCIAPITFTIKEVAGCLFQLRDTFLPCMAEEWLHREARVTKIAKRHRRKSLADLEERLRLHWPRKGNADVMYMQPRIGEISMHRKRLERQKRSVLQRHRAMGERFDKIVTASREQITNFLHVVDTLADMLRTQSSLAGLQGVMKRCKDSVMEFDENCAERIDEITPLVSSEPATLVESNERFLSTCLTHEEDGDYDIEEVDICKIALNKVNKYCAEDVKSRNETISEIQKEQREARGRFQNFADVYALTVKDLSMREGVGKKYGQPRRKFLESIRTVSTFSDRAKKKLDAALERIVILCNTSPNKRMDNFRKSGSVHHNTITRQLMRTALFVRMEFRIRLSYLEAQAEGSQARAGTITEEEESSLSVSLSTDPEDSLVITEENNESLELFGEQCFSSQIKSFKAECCQGTKQIYEDEGKLNEVGEDGVPEKLRTYLDRKENEALRYGLETAKEFRAQVDVYQRRLAEVPKALYRDVAARAKAVMKSHISDIERSFILKSDESDARKRIHKMELRPELGSPNYSIELEKLYEAEKVRSRKLCIDILEAERAVLKAIDTSSQEYLSEMKILTKSFMSLCDSTVAPWDIKDTRSPEEIEADAAAKSRPSLKTLRRKRAKELSGKIVPAGTILMKDWPSLPSGELDTKPYIIPKQAEENETNGDGDEANDESETLEKNEAITEGDNVADQSEEGTILQSKVTTAIRSLIRWRDRMYAEFKDEFHEMCRTYQMRFTSLLDAERIWIQTWEKMTRVLRLKSQEGGIL